MKRTIILLAILYGVVAVGVFAMFSLMTGCATTPAAQCGEVCSDGKVDSYVVSERFMCFCRSTRQEAAALIKQIKSELKPAVVPMPAPAVSANPNGVVDPNEDDGRGSE